MRIVRSRLDWPRFIASASYGPDRRPQPPDGIAEASARPTMRFVGVRSVAQGHIQRLRRTRQMTLRNRTGQCNQINWFLLEYGIESP